MMIGKNLLGGDSAFCFDDFDRRELELGDLAVGIDSRVGQDVGSRFDIGERHKHHVGRYRPIRARHDRDAAATA